MNKNQIKKIAAIDCDEAAKRFNDFLDDYLRGSAKDELMNHIADCRHCFERIEFEQMLKTKISTLSNATSPDRKATKIQLEKIISKIFSS